MDVKEELKWDLSVASRSSFNVRTACIAAEMPVRGFSRMRAGLERTWSSEERTVERTGMMIMMDDDPVLGVFMHCTVCTVRVSSSDAAPVQVK